MWGVWEVWRRRGVGASKCWGGLACDKKTSPWGTRRFFVCVFVVCVFVVCVFVCVFVRGSLVHRYQHLGRQGLMEALPEYRDGAQQRGGLLHACLRDTSATWMSHACL